MNQLVIHLRTSCSFMRKRSLSPRGIALLYRQQPQNSSYRADVCWQRSHSTGQELSEPVRVRYAPSPTGYLHLGGLRTALFNYLLARKTGGKFLLRIEDTDKTRQVSGSIEAIIKMLKWCGVDHDEGPDVPGEYGPYIQSERLPHYRQHAEQLVKEGQAYHCFCSSERLQTLRDAQTKRGQNPMYDRKCTHLSPKEVEERLSRGEPHVIRLLVPSGTSVVNDIIRGNVSFAHSTIDDQVLLKSDGFPTYHLASVVDDHLMRITHVIRGEEWLSSTPKHLILYKSLGFQPPKFAHLPLLLNPDKSKLSKRQGDVDVDIYQKKGFLPSALVNFVALLGWNPAGGDVQEVFTMDELIEKFSLSHVNKAGAVVDMNRLHWLNGEHMRKVFQSADESSEGGQKKNSLSRNLLEKQRAELVGRAKQGLLDFLTENAYAKDNQEAERLLRTGVEGDDEYLWKVLSLMKSKVHMPEEFAPLCYYFFVDPKLDGDDAEAFKAKIWQSGTTEKLLALFVEKLRDHADSEFSGKAAIDQIQRICKENKVKTKSLLMPIRYCVTGMNVGAGIGETLELLGKETTLSRIEQVLSS